jgi:hypothetical protein
MEKQLIEPSVFKDLSNIEYFNFEEDFIEEGIRCIPMIVRCKLDKAGIKLKIAEWVKFDISDKIEMALLNCENDEEIMGYHKYVSKLINGYTGEDATLLITESNPAWADVKSVPETLQEKAKEFTKEISIKQWQSLTVLQRFALTKLCKPGHENKNFPIALKEFGLMK